MQVIQRTCHLVGITETALRTILKANEQYGGAKVSNMKTKKYDLDSFDKDVIKRAMFHLFENNEHITLRKLQTYLIEKHDLKVCKFILWKCLHSFGIRYKKAERGRKALIERNDIVNTRINFLRSISKKTTGRIFNCLS